MTILVDHHVFVRPCVSVGNGLTPGGWAIKVMMSGVSGCMRLTLVVACAKVVNYVRDWLVEDPSELSEIVKNPVSNLICQIVG